MQLLQQHTITTKIGFCLQWRVEKRARPQRLSLKDLALVSARSSTTPKSSSRRRATSKRLEMGPTSLSRSPSSRNTSHLAAWPLLSKRKKLRKITWLCLLWSRPSKKTPSSQNSSLASGLRWSDPPPSVSLHKVMAPSWMEQRGPTTTWSRLNRRCNERNQATCKEKRVMLETPLLQLQIWEPHMNRQPCQASSLPSMSLAVSLRKWLCRVTSITLYLQHSMLSRKSPTLGQIQSSLLRKSSLGIRANLRWWSRQEVKQLATLKAHLRELRLLLTL